MKFSAQSDLIFIAKSSSQDDFRYSPKSIIFFRFFVHLKEISWTKNIYKWENVQDVYVTDCTLTYVFSSHFCFRSLFSRVWNWLGLCSRHYWDYLVDTHTHTGIILLFISCCLHRRCLYSINHRHNFFCIHSLFFSWAFNSQYSIQTFDFIFLSLFFSLSSSKEQNTYAMSTLKTSSSRDPLLNTSTIDELGAWWIEMVMFSRLPWRYHSFFFIIWASFATYSFSSSTYRR